MPAWSVVRIRALALGLPAAACLAIATASAGQDAAGPGPVLKDLRVFFKLDTGPTYGGPRWVPSPSFGSATAGRKDATVEARARGVDAYGRMVTVRASWLLDDTGVVTVTPREASEVKLVAQRAGEARLRVTAPGVSRELTLKAAIQDGILQLTVSEP